MKMANKRMKIKIGIVVSVSVLAIVLSVLAITQVVPQIRLSLADGGTVCDGVLPDVDNSLHITDVPEGEIRYLINKKIVFDDPYSMGDVMLENPESCDYDLQFVIYNVHGEMLYTSPMIKPGQYLEKDKLSTVVSSGEYKCSYSAQAYKNGELQGEVNGVVTISVK
jgi:hypothetical protein